MYLLLWFLNASKSILLTNCFRSGDDYIPLFWDQNDLVLEHEKLLKC